MKKNLILLFLSVSLQILAQQIVVDKISSGTNPPNANSVFSKHTASIDINKNSSQPGTGKVVFGYLPWWIYADSSYTTVLNHIELVTHIAVFSFEADTLGNLTAPPLWPWNDILTFTKMAGPTAPRVVMTVTNMNSNTIHRLLNDETVMLNLISNIKDTLVRWGMNGVNIDFENLLSDDQGSAINNFMLRLNNSIKADNSLAEISIAVPSVNWGNWDFKGLSATCDYMVVMGYDYYGNWSETTGPSAPFTGAGVKYWYDIQKSINEDFKDVVNANPDKLILGVPYYGNYWITNSSAAYCIVDTASTKRSWQSSPYYREIISQYDSKEKFWDNVSQTPWLKWQSGTTWNQIWYDNDSSLSLKYDFTLSKNLKGIGIWALGYDNGREELWNVIKKKFMTTDISQEPSTIPACFELYQNYPNPFNPGTIIKYSIPNVQALHATSLRVMLKIYDVLGREVVTLVDEEKNAGNYYSQFSILNSELKSGVYFYRLTAGGFVQTKKMILMK